jgi:hypothetical protein
MNIKPLDLTINNKLEIYACRTLRLAGKGIIFFEHKVFEVVVMVTG